MTNQGKLAGKVAIVTGGGGGFGAGITKKFVTEGAQVVAVDIDEAAVNRVARNWQPSQVIPAQADVASEENWKRILALTIEHFGRLDVVVNNAGVINQACTTIATPEAEYDKIMRVNVKSLYCSTKVIIPHFLARQQQAVFINVSSISASRPGQV